MISYPSNSPTPQNILFSLLEGEGGVLRAARFKASEKEKLAAGNSEGTPLSAQ